MKFVVDDVFVHIVELPVTGRDGSEDTIDIQVAYDGWYKLEFKGGMGMEMDSIDPNASPEMETLGDLFRARPEVEARFKKNVSSFYDPDTAWSRVLAALGEISFDRMQGKAGPNCVTNFKRNIKRATTHVVADESLVTRLRRAAI